MTRLRCLLPPPHVTVHPDHSSQSPHLQSIAAQPVTWHGITSARVPLQPSPPFCASDDTMRTRDCVPVPTVTEQGDQRVHGAMKQFSFPEGQAAVLQASVVFVGCQGQEPPLRLATRRFRSRYLWPPLHDLSHELHPPQSETRQSSGSGRLQPAVSSMISSQGLPSPRGGATISRERVRCQCSLSQSDQSDQSDISQSLEGQSATRQGSSWRSSPSQGAPPSEAGTSMRRWRE
mmetsp:Transcript_5377/g.15842  ORF Transcript_5377/g.15842 Transcript_5377/m.15842 type:complete len:233 (-) Transcript_5377:607-1305(-)